METQYPKKLLRLFGLRECDKCKSLRLLLESATIPYEYVDADSEDESIQRLCDFHGVDECPSVQILLNDEVVWEQTPAEMADVLLAFNNV
jgi:glutaredoxin